MTETQSPQAVLAFWRDAGPEKWFSRDDAFDAQVRARFLQTYEDAAAWRLEGWTRSAESTLALLIVLDQFPRNMFRGTPRAFAADALAREIAAGALAEGYDRAVPAALRGFFYLPFMHSEDLADQERCVALYRELGEPEGIKYAEIHADIIRRFGRFPHRNAVLGRTTTAEEQAFLDGGGFSG